MSGVVRIFSDLHLGHKVSRIGAVSALRPLIAGAGTAVFNGDTWQELARDLRPRSEEMLAELKALCAEENCEPVFLSGNHDPGWPGPGWVELAEGRVIVTHGDALLFDGSPWKREILAGAETVRALWAAHPLASEDAEERLRLAREIARKLRSKQLPKGRALWQRALDAVLPPARALKMIDAWLRQGRLGAEFCETYFPCADFLVIGHFHRHGSWRIGRRQVINTGSFVNPGRAHFVEWHDGWLKRREIRETPQACQPGETLDVWRV